MFRLLWLFQACNTPWPHNRGGCSWLLRLIPLPYWVARHHYCWPWLCVCFRSTAPSHWWRQASSVLRRDHGRQLWCLSVPQLTMQVLQDSWESKCTWIGSSCQGITRNWLQVSSRNGRKELISSGCKDLESRGAVYNRAIAEFQKFENVIKRISGFSVPDVSSTSCKGCTRWIPAVSQKLLCGPFQLKALLFCSDLRPANAQNALNAGVVELKAQLCVGPSAIDDQLQKLGMPIAFIQIVCHHWCLRVVSFHLAAGIDPCLVSIKIGYLLVAGQLSFFGDASIEVPYLLSFSATLTGILQLVPGSSSSICNYVRRHYSPGPEDSEWWGLSLPFPKLLLQLTSRTLKLVQIIVSKLCMFGNS